MCAHVTPRLNSVIALSDKKVRRVVAQLLRSTSFEVTLLINAGHVAEKLTDDAQYALMVTDSTFLGKLDEETQATLLNRVRRGGGKIVLLCSDPVKDAIPEMHKRYGVCNIVSGTSDALDIELLVTLNKLIHGEVFGLERYLPIGTKVVSRTIHESTRRPTLLQELREFIASVGCPERLGERLITAADELITNAVYDAPVDDEGEYLYRHVSRQIQIELPPGAEVSVKYACDGRRLGIAVTDNFGALTPETVVSYLERCFMKGANQIEEKKGGAGIGLFMIYDSVHNFVINIAPGRRTQIIGVIDIAGTYREALKMDTSFHLFVDDTRTTRLPE